MADDCGVLPGVRILGRFPFLRSSAAGADLWGWIGQEGSPCGFGHAPGRTIRTVREGRRLPRRFVFFFAGRGRLDAAPLAFARRPFAEELAQPREPALQTLRIDRPVPVRLADLRLDARAAL